MSDDISGFDWWFRNRDYVLRERLSEVESQAYAASARSNARLSSKLSRLQGSLEGRLNALSAAFDAYVELGDIREQLAAYGDSAAIRRESLAAIAALGDGQPTKPVDDRGADSWLATATNALIARVGGTPDDDTEAAARQQDQSAELFLVAGAAVLGHGVEVASRVPALLPSDGLRFDSHQQVLWQAVVDGVFGEGLLVLLVQDWQPSMTTDADDWAAWAQQRAGESGRTLLDWIEYQAKPGQPGSADATAAAKLAPADDVAAAAFDPTGASTDIAESDSGLRTLVFELINAGQGEERELLARARELRARIENPTASESPHQLASGRGVEESGDNPAAERSGIELMRAAYLDTAADGPAHAALGLVVHPGLLAVVEQQTPAILHQEPTRTLVRIHGHSVAVTAEGPDRSELAKAQAVPTVGDPANQNSRLYGFAGGAGAALVLALILALAGVSAAVVILLVVVAAVLAVFAGRVVLGRRREQQDAEQRRKRDLDEIEQAVSQAAQADAAQRVAGQESAAQLDRIRMALTLN